jgi:hypothetical protein
MPVKPIAIECDIKTLSQEARDWLWEGSTDLCWIQSDYRIEDREVTRESVITNPVPQHLMSPHLIAWYYRADDTSFWLTIKHDAVMFASPSDATYFKLTFL